MIARVGSMLAPFIISMKEIDVSYPPIVFGIVPLIGAALVLLLPETRGLVHHLFDFLFQYKLNNFFSYFFRQPLPATLEDGENFGKKSKK